MRKKSWMDMLLRKEWRAVGAAVIGVAYLCDAGAICSWQLGPAAARRAADNDNYVEEDAEHARRLVDFLVPMIRNNNEVIVRAEVEIDGLKADISTGDDELTRLREKLLRLRHRLAPPAPENSRGFVEGDLPRDQRRELRQLFSQFQTQEATLSAKRQLLRSREAALAKAQAAQEAALSRKRELDAQVAGLEARLIVLRAKDKDARVRVDAQKIAESDELIRGIRTRLLIAERVARLSRDTAVTTADAELFDEGIEHEIDRHFTEQRERRLAESR